MRLYIDTRESERVVVEVGGERVERKGRAQEVLVIIDELLKKQGKTVEEISEIEVAEGPGSFTGLRVGAAVANTLGWVLGVPVNGKNVEKEGGVEPKYGG